MERKIGEIFEYDGEWYQCVKSMIYCPDCAFFKRDCRHLGLGKCDAIRRSDNENVVFKKLEKVGEPFSCGYYGGTELIMMQEYKVQEIRVVHTGKVPIYVTDEKHKRVAIAIKQKQEDMEEKKLNLKEFNLEEAKQGKPVCTRDGRKARIICFDFKNDDYPLVAAVEEHEGKEVTLMYTNKGFFYKSEKKDNLDLMMLPEKKEGWLNIVKGTDGSYCCKGEVHSGYNDAILENINVLEKRGITVKIEWYE